MKPRIYIDTSVIGGCFDEELEVWSNQLIEENKRVCSLKCVKGKKSI